MMNRRYRVRAVAFPVLLLIASLSAWAQGQGAPGAAEPPIPDRPWETIDVAIVLDTSGSMEYLLKTAQVKLWEIVNDLALVEPSPRLRVAIVSYGSKSNGPERGWIRVETDFIEDLDLLSEKMFAVVQDHGSNEYVARAVLASIQDLSWTPSEETLKLLFVAGNEPADQDLQVSLEEISDLIDQEGISLQLIFCGQAKAEAAESWIELADWSGGRFATIDYLKRPVAVRTPFDAELAELSRAINKTFIPLGEEGQKRQEKSIELDEKVQRLSPAAAASRAEVKSSPLYSSGWDLVDAVESGETEIYEIDEDQLPEDLRAMTPRDREYHIQDMQDRRLALRERITLLSEQRRQYVTREMKAKGIDTSRAFDTVVKQAIREKLEERGFRAPGR